MIIACLYLEHRRLYDDFNHVSGCADRGSLLGDPAAVLAERAGVHLVVHPDRHAGDARVGRAGRHQHLHLDAHHGLQDRLHRRKVSARAAYFTSLRICFHCVAMLKYYFENL